MASVVPTEEQEQQAFVQWLEIKGYPHHHSPNETGGGRGNAIRGRKMKIMGTSKGFPDLLVFLPIENRYGEVDAYQPIAIEMKRQKGGTTSQEQKGWLALLEQAGIPNEVCHGCKEAIEFVEQQMREVKGEY
jgi:hypothetical protein